MIYSINLVHYFMRRADLAYGMSLHSYANAILSVDFGEGFLFFVRIIVLTLYSLVHTITFSALYTVAYVVRVPRVYMLRADLAYGKCPFIVSMATS